MHKNELVIYPKQTKKQKIKIINNEIIWLILICIIVFLMRLPLSTRTVIDWDESVYFTIAQDILHGGVPYKTMWDHKGPMMFFVFVPVIKLFGNSIIALRIFTTLYLLTSMFFVYFISLRLFGKAICLIPPLIYGLFFMQFGGLASNGELFMMLPLIIATLCFIYYWQGVYNQHLMLFLCGFFSATAILFKATSLFTALILPITIIIKSTLYERFNFKRLRCDLVWYFIGGITTLVLIIGYFLYHHSVIDFYNGFYLFNTLRVNVISFKEGLTKLCDFLWDTIKWNLITQLTFVSTLFIFLRRDYNREQKQVAIFLISLMFGSLVGVLWGKYMFSHYFLQMSLSFALLIGFAVSLLEIDVAFVKKIVSILLIMMLLLFCTNAINDFNLNYKTNYKKSDEYKVAEYIKNNTNVNETIFVMGGQPIIYFLSERKSPTKYFFWIHHTGELEQILEKLKMKNSSEDYDKTKPTYIITPSGDPTHVNYRDEIRIGGYKLQLLNTT